MTDDRDETSMSLEKEMDVDGSHFSIGRSATGPGKYWTMITKVSSAVAYA
jgi:hypothetical protein